jgi:hypothetical protein
MLENKIGPSEAFGSYFLKKMSVKEKRKRHKEAFFARRGP